MAVGEGFSDSASGADNEDVTEDDKGVKDLDDVEIKEAVPVEEATSNSTLLLTTTTGSMAPRV
ncbi:hypothetical protein PInf_011624 [Phytophthora infestans]|nr:hypothetical protein PInf_011624 [Phytophthora infestans]